MVMSTIECERRLTYATELTSELDKRTCWRGLIGKQLVRKVTIKTPLGYDPKKSKEWHFSRQLIYEICVHKSGRRETANAVK
jgi:hypothetical protein